MSVFTPPPSGSRSTMRFFWPARLVRFAAWSYVVSAALHLLVYAAALRLAPVGGIASSRAAASPASAAESRRVAEIRQRVNDLAATGALLEQIRDEKQAEYDRWAQPRIENAPAQVRQSLAAIARAQQRTRTAQQAAKQAQQAALRAAESLSTPPAPATPPAETAARQRQAAAQEIAAKAAAAEQAQKTLQQAQAEISTAQRDVLQALRFAHAAADPDARRALEAAQESLEAARQKQEDAGAAQQSAAAPQAEAREAAKAMVAAAEQERTAERAAEQAMRKTRGQTSPPSGAPPKAPSTQKAPPSDHPEVQAASEVARQAREAGDRARADALQKQQATADAQANAGKAQAAADQAQRQAAKLAASALRGVEAQAARGRQAGSPRPGDAPSVMPGPDSARSSGNSANGASPRPRSGAPGRSETAGMPGATGGETVEQLYASARAMERNNVQAFRQLRAAELARIRQIPLEDAMGEAAVNPPSRPDLDANLSGIERAEAARREIGRMGALADRLLEQAQSAQASGAGASVSLDGAREGAAQTAARARALQAMAQQDPNAVARDLTGLMEGQPGGDRNMNARADPNGPSRIEAGPPLPPPALDGAEIQAIPGRRVGAGGRATGWMFVDSWYTIGPFPNPNRANLHKSFPPETLVDLDATYAGKNNRTIRWQFVQSAGPLVTPADPEEYAIYYAYTELWFDRPQDLWIAVGSDDKSTLWIENQLVWESSDSLKAWNVGEGLRRVHFKKGVNRVLARIENGWRGVGMSLVIALRPPRR